MRLFYEYLKEEKKKLCTKNKEDENHAIRMYFGRKSPNFISRGIKYKQIILINLKSMEL